MATSPIPWKNRSRVAQVIRSLQPRLVLTHLSEDRHPDHPRAHDLVRDSVFFAGVGNFPAPGERWRAEAIAFFPGNSFKG